MGEEGSTGLTTTEVDERRARGQTNDVSEHTSRSVAHILRANLLTRFNLILGALLVTILIVGQLQDAIFGVILIANALIGIVQELRAKFTLDRLALLNAPRVRALRDGELRDLAVADLVLDDVVDVHLGDQLVVDGVVLETTGAMLDESELTGESRPVDKHGGSTVLSGSFVVAGSARYRATAVGAECYARKLTAEARRFTVVKSELVEGLNRVLRYVTIAFVPVALLTVFSQLHANPDVRGALTATVAALAEMVPQGLVLLMSVAFGAAAVALARRHVLVHQLPAVEGLARVDVVCFDKTGTITDGSIVFDRIEVIDAEAPLGEALGALVNDENRNATAAAIAAHFPPHDTWERAVTVPFSSTRKWSGATFNDHGTWVMGAPEMVLVGDASAHLTRADELAALGTRVLALARGDVPLQGEALPAGLEAVALLMLAERVRADAADTIRYFAAQGVTMKVISGDNPRTVAAVASRVGIPGADNPADARELPSDADALADVIESRSVFGRVTPQQKEDMVTALQHRGHAVAMTGDGVNDALALKLADIGVAMGSGASATKAVADLVLLNGDFSTMPSIVAQGRQVTANIERVSNIFLTKTVWATLLALAVGIAFIPYPFLPRHLTVISTLTIGIPSFFLALTPNARRYMPGFINRVLRFAIPNGVIVAAAIFIGYLVARAHHLTLDEERTATTLIALMVSLAVLALLAMPFTWRRVILILAVVASFALLFPVRAIRNFYALSFPHEGVATFLLVGGIGIVALVAYWVLSHRLGHAPVRVEPAPRRRLAPSVH